MSCETLTQFGNGLSRQCTQTHNNGAEILTFTEQKPDMKHKTQKNDPSPKLQELSIIIVHM